MFAGEQRVEKPGTPISIDLPLKVRGKEHPWVSRGGMKLDHALSHFDIDATGATALDVGASTGGFTDVLLTRGAAKVYAVDVGYGQLNWKLRRDDRVVVLERQNARQLTQGHIPELVDMIVCDASFIGLEKVLATPLTFATPGAHLAALIKPQFEVGKGEVGKGGVVRDPEQHRAVCAKIEAWLDNLMGWRVVGIDQSPITGAEGNVEFLIVARRDN